MKNEKLIIPYRSNYEKKGEFKNPSFEHKGLVIEGDGHIHGKVYNDIEEVWKEKKWNKETGKVYGSGNATYFDLVPVIKENTKACDGMWNGYYIEASQEAYGLLIADGYVNTGKSWNWIGIKDCEIMHFNSESATKHQFKKPLYIVDGKLSATQYHPDEVGSANSVFCKKEVCDSYDLEIEELKVKYATGKYDCYSKWIKGTQWLQHFKPSFDTLGHEYKLILKEHSYIADAVVANPDVEIQYERVIDAHLGIDYEYSEWRDLGINFFDNYNEYIVYQLKQQPKQVSEDTFTVTEHSVPTFSSRVHNITNNIAEMLIEKNDKYGNSALEPKRIFSKMDSIEQLYVRIDDKLSRISNKNLNDDEDVIEDLIGYLVLLKIAKS